MGLFRDIVNSGMIYKREIIKSEECHPHNVLLIFSESGPYVEISL